MYDDVDEWAEGRDDAFDDPDMVWRGDTDDRAGASPTLSGTTGSASRAAMAGVLGCVASPARYEATTTRFYFWVCRDTLVEVTQLVCTASSVSGRRSFAEERDVKDGDPAFQPHFKPDGTTYCEVTVLRTEPPYLTPPIEESPVYLGGPDAAARAYDYPSLLDPESGTDWGLTIGLLRNGGAGTSGPAKIDVRDLCGDRAGHLNVTGQAGHGTKSSFVLVAVRSLVDFARRRDDGDPAGEPFSVRPIVFNVKGNDLMYIDQPNRHLDEAGRERWRAMGVEPRPFEGATFYAPCQAGSGSTGVVNRANPRVLRAVPADRQTRPYYWTLADVVGFGLWPYLFSDTAQQSETMSALADHILGLIAEDCDPDKNNPAGLRLRTRTPGAGSATPPPRSFAELVEWLREALRDPSHPARDRGIHTFATCRALLSRLGIVRSPEGRAIFDDRDGHGEPLHVVERGTTDPMVIDIAGLPVELRRFVVAAVLDQVKERQMGADRTPGQVYVLVLDELAMYAPRCGRDAITRLFEHVAAQLRSQGIILFSAQQQASKVSETILGNSEFKALGVTSSSELEAPTWGRLLTAPQKARALQLGPEEKMVRTHRGWMNVVVPFPA